MEPETPSHAVAKPSFQSELVSVGLIVAAFAGMLAFSWQKWGDPIIDFGRELYVAWRLHEGDVLYRDLAHYYAPLSSYLNATWLGVFGVSYRSLMVGNSIVLAGLLLLFFRVLRSVTDQFTATVAILVTILVFGFGQYLPVDNYNFLSPYSHELTHGLLLTAMAIGALSRHVRSSSRGSLALTGALVGLVFLTKYEVFVAAFGGVAIALAAHQRWTPRPSRTFRVDVLTFAVAVATPVVACLGLLTVTLTPVEAMNALLGAYYFMLGGQAAASQLIWNISGLTNAGPALVGMLTWTACYVMATLPAAFISRRKRALGSQLRTVAAALLPLTVLIVVAPVQQWRQALLPLPIFLIARLIATLVGRTAPDDPASLARRLTHLCLNAVALLLLIRTPLNTSTVHYGFALALPGTLLLIVFLIDEAPRWLEARGLSGRDFRMASMVLLGAFCVRHVTSSAQFFGQRTQTLGQQADTMKVDDRGAVVANAVQLILDRVKPQETLVVFPEGALVNYLSRRRSPVQNVVFHPTALSMYGESTLVAALAAHPPNYILAFSSEMRDLREMGCPIFGVDCAQSIAAWQAERYTPLVLGVSEGRTLFTLLVQADPGSPRSTPTTIEVFPR